MKLIRSSTIKACKLDPLPATIIRNYYSALVPVFKTVLNLSLSTGSMPEDLNIASLRPLLKKPNADCGQFSNQRPVSNVKFLSKLVEKSIFVQLNYYLTVNGLHERFQSAYKAHHSTETALLTITNDILLSLDRGHNVFLLLLIRLINLCYFSVWRTRLALRELFCSGFIHICLADLSLSKLMEQNRRLGI